VSPAGRPLRLLALSAYATLLALEAPAWPDDWDGVGFLESVSRFDLARFQPHPPGYPVYVALLRVAAWVAHDPMRAAVIVAVASGVVTVACTWDTLRAVAGERAAWCGAVLVAAAPVVWRACSGVGSEAPALACLAASAWGLARGPKMGPWRGVATGLAAGLGLGARLSWAPLFAAALFLTPRGSRLRAGAAAALGTTTWAVPLVALVGPARLYALYEVHFAGHAQRWGGTFVTEPGAVRVAWLARDVLVDGLGVDRDALGVALSAVLLSAAVLAMAAWRAASWRGWKAALLVVVPYALWIALGQNLRDQPRHALPLVAILAAALSLPAATGRRVTLGLLAALATLLATRAALDAHARRTIPPPGQQLLELARAQPEPQRLAVYGVSSVRFFENTEMADRAAPAGSLGDVQIRLTRLDRLPSQVWVTGEVEGRDSSSWPLEPVATLCRPPRLDRRAPCLGVWSWKLPYLR
jgi:hypothetical protein